MQIIDLVLKSYTKSLICAPTVAIDMSPAQNALLEIKLAAIQHLEYQDYLCLLGERAESQDSRSRYMILKMSQVNYFILHSNGCPLFPS